MILTVVSKITTMHPSSGERGEKGLEQINRVTKDSVTSEQDGRLSMK